MEISKQNPPISANTKTPCVISTDEWLENNKDCVTELKFDLNHDIQKHICNAKTNISKKMGNLYLELKSFGGNGPGFDIGSITGYIDSLSLEGGVEKKLFKTNYLCFEYGIENEKCVIKKFWMLKVWDLC